MHVVAVITSPCIGTKDTACAAVCPINCFYDEGEMLLVNPDECINCGLCYAECPVAAIIPSDEVPEAEAAYIEKASAFFAEKTDAELDALRVLP